MTLPLTYCRRCMQEDTAANNRSAAGLPRLEYPMARIFFLSTARRVLYPTQRVCRPDDGLMVG